MVFTSVPPYLDWNQLHFQHQNHQSGSSITIENMQQQQQLPSAPPPPIPSMRPNPQPDRGRIAKISQPETALKCPRCESTNTKFCYFNNYSLSQPRHFCKTCRRYWTRGGALRSVPVGGGCRRNKKTKSTSSRSSTTSENPKGSSITSSTSMVQSNSTFTSDAISHMHTQLPQLPFINSLHHLTEYHRNDLNLNFSAIHTPPVLSTSTTGNIGGHYIENSTGSGEQWRRHQFPILAGMDPQTGLYRFGEGVEFMGGGRELIQGKPSASVMTQVKTEENQGLNISRTFSDIARNDQYWGSGNGWTDISGLTSSSTNLD